MKREHTQKAMILLILYCIIAFPHFAIGQNGNQSPPQLKKNGSCLLLSKFNVRLMNKKDIKLLMKVKVNKQ